jgi:hypothetical protein
MMAQAEQCDGAAHRLGDQHTRAARRRQGPRKQRQIARIAIKTPRPRAARPTARALGTTLSTPVETPHREAAGGEVGDRLEVFLDAFGKAADQHALTARLIRQQVPPAQLRPVAGRKTAPDEPRRFEKPRRQRGDAHSADPLVFASLSVVQIPLIRDAEFVVSECRNFALRDCNH